MKYLDEYRDSAVAKRLNDQIKSTATRRWTIMEVCGGQTHTICQYGLEDLLPEAVNLVHGPGCPICVTPLEQIDKAIAIAQDPQVIFCSFGDMLRVPGSNGDLLDVKARGGDVRVVYSPLDCIALARANPERKVVFFAVGFETTAPANAMAAWQARMLGLGNFFILAHMLRFRPYLQRSFSRPRIPFRLSLRPGMYARLWAGQNTSRLVSAIRFRLLLLGLSRSICSKVFCAVWISWRMEPSRCRTNMGVL